LDLIQNPVFGWCIFNIKSPGIFLILILLQFESKKEKEVSSLSQEVYGL
jgi:hypothetical protein